MIKILLTNFYYDLKRKRNFYSKYIVTKRKKERILGNLCSQIYLTKQREGKNIGKFMFPK